jgi:vacuolar iron transporter family protein
MPQTPHVESHFTASEFVRDIVIGMADGLTVPFALAAGLSGADTTTRIIVVAGLAEIAAGSIAMGLGGYLAAKNDADHYASELKREQREVEELPEVEAQEVLEVFEAYGLSHAEAVPIVDTLRQRPKRWVDFMMRFELGLEEPDPKRALRSASTIAGAYIAGGLIPLAPYMLMSSAYAALIERRPDRVDRWIGGCRCVWNCTLGVGKVTRDCNARVQIVAQLTIRSEKKSFRRFS